MKLMIQYVRAGQTTDSSSEIALASQRVLSATLHHTALAPQTTHTHVHAHTHVRTQSCILPVQNAGKHSGDTGMERLAGNEGCGGSAYAQSHTFSLLPPLPALSNCFYFRGAEAQQT